MQGILTIPEFAWELFLDVYRTIWGFRRESQILSGDCRGPLRERGARWRESRMTRQAEPTPHALRCVARRSAEPAAHVAASPGGAGGPRRSSTRSCRSSKAL